MSTAATIPFTPAQPKPWIPTDRDRLIFQWVKFDGQTQSWVADQLEISQSTVSRIVERYERWIARGGPAQQGGLTHDERLRTQRWLTYERNERILASALRIAGEMEQAIEASKSTIRRPMGNPGAETQVFTEHRMIDRSGLAARYLRLAYRINMEQLKLVQQEPLPPLPLGEGQGEGFDPLTLEDLGDNAPCHGYPASAVDDPLPLREDQAEGLDADLTLDSCPLTPDPAPLRASAPPRETPPAELKTENRKPEPVSVIELSPDASPVHKTHNPQSPKSPSTASLTTSYAQSHAQKKPSKPAYPLLPGPPEMLIDPSQSTPSLRPPITDPCPS